MTQFINPNNFHVLIRTARGHVTVYPYSQRFAVPQRTYVLEGTEADFAEWTKQPGGLLQALQPEPAGAPPGESAAVASGDASEAATGASFVSGPGSLKLRATVTPAAERNKTQPVGSEHFPVVVEDATPEPIVQEPPVVPDPAAPVIPPKEAPTAPPPAATLTTSQPPPRRPIPTAEELLNSPDMLGVSRADVEEVLRPLSGKKPTAPVKKPAVKPPAKKK